MNIDLEWTWKKVVATYWGAVPTFTWRERVKTQKTSVRTVSRPMLEPNTSQIRMKVIIDCARLPHAAVRARQTRSIVYRVRVQHRSAAAACGCWSTLFLTHKTVSTERAQHTEIPLPRDNKPLWFGSTRTKFARGSVRFAALGKVISSLRGKETNIASRGRRAQSITGFIDKANSFGPSNNDRIRRMTS
jgi:hypothetical protein